MNRPAGVTAAAIVLILDSLFYFALVAFLVFFVLTMPMPELSPGQYFPKSYFISSIAMFGGIGMWGLTTALGVWRMRRWGRISMLGFSGMLVFANAVVFMVFFVLFPSLEANADQFVNTVRMSMAAFYLIQVLTGIWWLIYFSLPKVKNLFLKVGPVPADVGCPLSIKVIAWHFVIIGLLTVVSAWFQWPAIVLGVLTTGWKASLVYLLWGAAGLYIGIGLLRLRPQSLMYAVYYFLFGAANTTIFYLLPNSASKMRQLMEHMRWAQTPGMETEPVLPSVWVSILLGLLGCGIPVWYLLTRKERYLAAAAAKKETP